MAKLSPDVKFMNFVNRSIGKPLTATTIASKTKINPRTVQNYCRRVRATKSVSTEKQGNTIVYTFKTPISSVLS